MTLDPAELERRLDRALKQLPVPAAPPAFASRVMGRIGAGPRATFEWPVALKIALVAMSALLITGAWVAWPIALEFASTSWHSPAVEWLRASAGALRPMVPAALMYVTAMCAVSAAAASMLKHVALGGAQQS